MGNQNRVTRMEAQWFTHHATAEYSNIAIIEYSINHSKTSRYLWQYYRDELSLNNDDDIVGFTGANHNSNLFKIKQQITGQTDASGRKKN